MRGSSLIWWFGALILAGLAGLVTYQSLATAMPAATAGDPDLTQPVVVAAVNIPFRRSISEEELTLRYYPIEAVPANAAATPDQVIGKMSAENILAGEPIMIPKMVTPDIVTKQLALSVPSGKTVMAVPIQSLLLVNRLIRPGDRIDLIGTFALELNGTAENSILSSQESIAILQNLEVHAIIVPSLADEEISGAVGNQQPGTFNSSRPEEQAVLLALAVQDALVIRHILDTGGTLDLILRAPEDESMNFAVAVDGAYLAERYQILTGPR